MFKILFCGSAGVRASAAFHLRANVIIKIKIQNQNYDAKFKSI